MCPYLPLAGIDEVDLPINCSFHELRVMALGNACRYVCKLHANPHTSSLLCASAFTSKNAGGFILCSGYITFCSPCALSGRHTWLEGGRCVQVDVCLWGRVHVCGMEGRGG